MDAKMKRGTEWGRMLFGLPIFAVLCLVGCGGRPAAGRGGAAGRGVGDGGRGRGGGRAPPPRGPAGRRSGRRPLKPPGGRLGCAPVPAAFAGRIPAQGAFL